MFDRLFDAAHDVVLRGAHRRDTPPVEGGRWPITVVCVPPEIVRIRLEQLMRAALVHAGPGHCLTGRRDTSHLTVRALEPYRDAAALDDPVTAEYLDALERATRRSTPLAFHLTGVTLTPGSLMAQLEPQGDAPWQFMKLLADELGPMAWYEGQGQRRDIWYANLIHFAAPILDARAFVKWVGDYRLMEPLEFVVDTASLVRSRYTEVGGERYMAMEQWSMVSFGGGR